MSKKKKARASKLVPRHDWLPLRRGNVYCSPACGRGCTIGEYREAQEKGAALARQLGKDWDHEVSENLGWHYRAFSRRARLYVTKTEHNYWAFLGGGQFSASGTTPQEAVRAVIEQAYTASRRILDLIKGLVS